MKQYWELADITTVKVCIQFHGSLFGSEIIVFKYHFRSRAITYLWRKHILFHCFLYWSERLVLQIPLQKSLCYLFVGYSTMLFIKLNMPSSVTLCALLDVLLQASGIASDTSHFSASFYNFCSKRSLFTFKAKHLMRRKKGNSVTAGRIFCFCHLLIKLYVLKLILILIAYE
jgi:hypothetical protein